MPFKSEKQCKIMYANHPEIAERWSAEEKGKKKSKKKAKRRRRPIFSDEPKEVLR